MGIMYCFVIVLNVHLFRVSFPIKINTEVTSEIATENPDMQFLPLEMDEQSTRN